MPERPNILLIVADQLAWKALPAYGNRDVATPNIDRLAARGVRFSKCYSPCPLCQPARAAFWTGRFPHETGVRSNGRNDPVAPIADSMPTLGEVFQQAGYSTQHFGKTHDAGALRGFACAKGGETPIDDADSKIWMLNYDTLMDRNTTEQATAFLANYDEPDTPYLTVVDLNNPHNICGWVGENAGAHEDRPIPTSLPLLWENFHDTDTEKRPKPVQYVCCAHNRQAQGGGWTDENFRYYLAAYYHYVTRLDREVGCILDALEQRRDAENTLILFMADHGDGMGAHRLLTKHTTFYEETTRVPFIAAGAGIVGRNRVIESSLMSLLDLLPTLCDYAEIQPPDNLWGRSVMPLLREESAAEIHAYVVSEWYTEWGFTIEPGRMIRSAHYKYTRYIEDAGEELFDLVADPGETQTLIDNPAHADALAVHRRMLDEHIAQTDDDFFSLEWRAAERWRSHALGCEHHIGIAAPMAAGITVR